MHRILQVFGFCFTSLNVNTNGANLFTHRHYSGRMENWIEIVFVVVLLIWLNWINCQTTRTRRAFSFVYVQISASHTCPRTEQYLYLHVMMLWTVTEWAFIVLWLREMCWCWYHFNLYPVIYDQIQY